MSEVNNPAKNEVIKMFNPKNKISNLENQEETKPTDETDRKWNMNENVLKLYTKKMAEDQKLKSNYAITLIIILAIELIALIVIFILNGCNVLKYADTTFNIFITGGIAEVFLLVRIIVDYLFKDNLTSALNIILESNNKTENNRTKEQKKNDKQ